MQNEIPDSTNNEIRLLQQKASCGGHWADLIQFEISGYIATCQSR